MTIGSCCKTRRPHLKSLLLAVALALCLQLDATIAVSAPSGECKRLGPCSCQYATGELVDMGKTSTPNSYFMADDRMSDYIYAWNPCYSTNFPGSGKTDVGPLQVSRNQSPVRFFYLLGKFSTAQFSTVINTLSLKYTDGEGGRNSAIKLICDTTSSDTLTFINEASLTYTFQFRGPSACPVDGPSPTDGPDNGGGSSAWTPGAVILLMLVILIVLYVIIGVLVNMYVRHKSGVREVLPNFVIWVALPGVALDGGKFVFNKVRGRSTDGPYEKF